MDTIYFDNAASTFIDEDIIEVMRQAMLADSGNPSATHQFGRRAKATIEMARKNIAQHFNATASEFIFTSGGTEANNLILHNAVSHLKVKRIVTSKIEHHAILRTVAYLKQTYDIEVIYVNTDAFGSINLRHLESILADTKTDTLVSLLHINNEIGTILPIDKVLQICKKYDALFHSDTVQSVGFHPIDLQQTPLDFITASAHKFHGPKGIGFAYFKKGFQIAPLLHGGGQEKGVRAGTQNVHGILGMATVLEKALKNRTITATYLTDLKAYFIKELKAQIPGVAFNGLSDDLEQSSYKILNVRFPVENAMLAFHLDLAGIAVSTGSACQSGSHKGSYVLNEILDEMATKKTSIRFSFSKNNTKAEIDQTIKTLQVILKPV